MPTFPNSPTGNLIFTIGTRDKFILDLKTNGSIIDLTSSAVTLFSQHKRTLTTVNSFPTGVASARVSVVSATLGAIQFQTLSGDFTTTGEYNYNVGVWDVNSDPSFVPEHKRYTMTILSSI
jgi:WD40 repeat protein